MLEVQQRSGRKRGAISPRRKGLQYVESREGLHYVEISFLPTVWHQIGTFLAAKPVQPYIKT